MTIDSLKTIGMRNVESQGPMSDTRSHATRTLVSNDAGLEYGLQVRIGRLNDLAPIL